MLPETQPLKPMSVARSTNKNPKCDSPEAKRIVIVDDHPLFRKGLQELIHSDDSFAVCGEASNASEAMEVIRKLHPDLAIVDLSLPGANGIELIKNIRAEYPKLPILVLSMHDESLYALRAMRAGADGYVMKHEAMANVVQAVHEVFQRTALSQPRHGRAGHHEIRPSPGRRRSRRRRETERSRTRNPRADRQRQRSASDRQAVESQPKDRGNAHERTSKTNSI